MCIWDLVVSWQDDPYLAHISSSFCCPSFFYVLNYARFFGGFLFSFVLNHLIIRLLFFHSIILLPILALLSASLHPHIYPARADSQQAESHLLYLLYNGPLRSANKIFLALSLSLGLIRLNGAKD